MLEARHAVMEVKFGSIENYDSVSDEDWTEIKELPM
jgi:hypothetical protein